MDHITLRAQHGYSITVPASLDCITTYVLLEQERWFELEIDFLLKYLRPGMTAIDIGANLGVYSLPLASRLGESGAVFSYEPGGEARECLQASLDLNGFQNFRLSPCALSNRSGRLWLAHGASSELNELKSSFDEGGAGEMVDVVTLDAEMDKHGWESVDFIKIDAEGQEARIVLGGRSFFTKHSPLVMYEVIDVGKTNHQLRWVFEMLDYRTYRLSGDSSYLVRVDDDDPGSAFELNYFSAKPDRAAALLASGLLVDAVEAIDLTPEERELALDALLGQPFAMALEFSREDFADAESPYVQALLAYAAYLYLGWPPARRHMALLTAHRLLSSLKSESASLAVISTLSRVAASLHYGGEAIGLLDYLRAQIGGDAELAEPFFPASEAFERLPIANDDVHQWFAAGVVDAWICWLTFSSVFTFNDLAALELAALEWLNQSAYTGPELKRRLLLKSLREKGTMATVGALDQGHLNPVYWTDGAKGLMGLVRRPLDKV